MMTYKPNAPAFPKDYASGGEPGLTKREYIATQFLAARIARGEVAMDGVAYEWAFKKADALLAASEKGS